MQQLLFCNQKDHPGGWVVFFYRTRRGGPGPIGRGNHDQALCYLTWHIIADPTDFDNLWKVK